MTMHLSSYTTRLPSPKRVTGAGGLVFLAFVWGVSALVLISPLADSLSMKAFFLLPPIMLTMLVTIRDPAEGFTLWSLGLAALVTQTGFQLDVAGIRISALEVVIAALLILLIFLRRKNLRLQSQALALPGQMFLILFIVYSIVLLFISLTQGTPINNALFQFKGFLLYPLTAYIMIAGIRTRTHLNWIVRLLIVWYSVAAGRGIVEVLNGTAVTGADVARANGAYGPVNIYGITLAAMALLVLGISISAKARWHRLAGTGVAAWLFVGAITSVARTAWIAFAAGLLVLLISNKNRRITILLLTAIASAVLLYLLPDSITGRILQLSDSSTSRRAFYLVSGLEAWKARWLTGWGWGRAFWSSSRTLLSQQFQLSDLTLLNDQLVAARGIPWYHSDYLNLAVQTGVIGLGLFVAFWGSVVKRAFLWLQENMHTDVFPYVQGSAAALIGLLAAAGFEHVFWRPDIGGFLGLCLGLLIASMRLHRKEKDGTDVTIA